MSQIYEHVHMYTWTTQIGASKVRVLLIFKWNMKKHLMSALEFTDFTKHPSTAKIGQADCKNVREQ